MDINGIKSRGKLTEELRQWFPYDWDFINHKQTGKFQCAYCGKFVRYRDITEDHIYPKCFGGPRIVTSACQPCNNAKGNKLPIEWAIYAYENNLDIGEKLVRKATSKITRTKEKEFDPWTISTDPNSYQIVVPLGGMLEP